MEEVKDKDQFIKDLILLIMIRITLDLLWMAQSEWYQQKFSLLEHVHTTIQFTT